MTPEDRRKIESAISQLVERVPYHLDPGGFFRGVPSGAPEEERAWKYSVSLPKATEVLDYISVKRGDVRAVDLAQALSRVIRDQEGPELRSTMGSDPRGFLEEVLEYYNYYIPYVAVAFFQNNDPSSYWWVVAENDFLLEEGEKANEKVAESKRSDEWGPKEDPADWWKK